jgi:hypothetical protein
LFFLDSFCGRGELLPSRLSAPAHPAAFTALAATASFLSRKTESREIMKSEQLKDAIQHATDRFAASLREGQSELLRN